jgi:hypothetical protein
MAELVASGNANDIDRILADDFAGVDSHGSMYDKAKMISITRDGPTHYSSNHLSNVKIRFFGDMAIAQRSESWQRRSGRARALRLDRYLASVERSLANCPNRGLGRG